MRVRRSQNCGFWKDRVRRFLTLLVGPVADLSLNKLLGPHIRFREHLVTTEWNLHAVSCTFLQMRELPNGTRPLRKR